MREYWHDFSHPQVSQPLRLPVEADTSCLARQGAWAELERMIREVPGLPASGWSLIRQDVRPEPL